MENIMTVEPHTPGPEPAQRREFDRGRSAEIRQMLRSTVASTPQPRTVRLSRGAFALTAAGSLLFAGGSGAALVALLDAPARTTTPGAMAPAAAPTPASSDFSFYAASPSRFATPGLTELVTINGRTGYAYGPDVIAANEAIARNDTLIRTEAVDSSIPATPPPHITIYAADGTTVLGVYEPTVMIDGLP
jgi:hypothetical protein